MPLFICGFGGSDAVVGGDTTAAQMLSRCGTVVGGVASYALKSKARLDALLTNYANENAGAKYLDIAETDIVVNGPVSGTSADPTLGSALCNCAGVGTPANLRRWTDSDPLPPGTNLLRYPMFDGAAKIGASVLGAWTYDAAATTWSASPLPAAWASANVVGILFCPNTLVDKQHRPRHTLRKAAETTVATYKAAITAAIANGNQRDYDNTFVIENVGGTTLTICMRVTEQYGTRVAPAALSGVNLQCVAASNTIVRASGDFRTNFRVGDLYKPAGFTNAANNKAVWITAIDQTTGANITVAGTTLVDEASASGRTLTPLSLEHVIDNTCNGLRVYFDNNADGTIAALVTVAADATKGVADNALVCFQNPSRAGGEWLTIDSFEFANVGQTPSGKYALSIENGQRVRINYPRLESVGHHGSPGITGGTAFADQDTTDIEVVGCVSGRSFGQSGGAFNVISCGGNNLTRIRFRDGIARYGAVLSPAGVASSNAAGSLGWFSGGSNVYSKPLTDVEIKNYQFLPDPAFGEATVNGGVAVKNTAAIASGQEMNGSAYPLRFRESVFGSTCNANFYSYGTRDSTSGGPGAGATPNDVLASMAFIDSVLLFNGGGGASNGTFGTYGLLTAAHVNNWASGAGALPAGFPRNVLFERSLIVIDSGVWGGFANAINFYGQSGKGGHCWRFNKCVIIDVNRSRRGTTRYWFDYINTGAAGNGYNMGVVCWDSVLLNLYSGYTAAGSQPVNRLFANDSNLEARTEITGATRATWQDFQRNYYGGFSPTIGFSTKTALDSKTEWLAGDGAGGGDPAGAADDAVNINSSAMVARIRAALGGNLLGGGFDPMVAISQALGGGIVDPAVIKSGNGLGAGIAIGMAIGNQG